MEIMEWKSTRFNIITISMLGPSWHIQYGTYGPPSLRLIIPWHNPTVVQKDAIEEKEVATMETPSETMRLWIP